MPPKTRSLFQKYRLLGLILLITLINGFIYVFVVPPWQHYDEPTNFEYAWLIANRPGLPRPGDYDATMRRQVAASMIEHRFYGRDNPGPDLDAQEDPVWIGISQIEDRPFAYWAASLPLRWMKTRSVTNQLYAGRMVSLIFYLILVTSAWGVMREITRPGSSLRWIFPLTLALFPGLSNLMTSLNNDAAAVAVFSLFLWGSVRIIQRGFSILELGWVIGTALLCYYTKITAYFALLLLPVVLVLAGLNGKRRLWANGFLSMGLVVMLFSFFSMGDAASWYRSTVQEAPVRLVSNDAVAGKYVFQLDSNAVSYPSAHRPIFQPILKDFVAEIRGNTVTLGAWIWASQPGEASTPILGDGYKSYSKKINITTEPKFYAFKAHVEENSIRAYVMLPANITPNEPGVKIYYDSVILVAGEWPLNEVPELSDDGAQSGYWGGKAFTNILRNSSAEVGTIRAQPWLDELIMKYASYYSGPSFNLHYLLDIRNVDWHLNMSAYRLFTTFWGQFGWGNVPLLLGSRPYRLLAIITALTIIGSLISAIRNRKSLPWITLLIFGLSTLAIWGIAFFRGTSHLSVAWFYIPVARYAYPAIIPTMLVFCIGALELLGMAKNMLRLPSKTHYIIYLGFMILLNVVAVYSISKFYYL
jgi:hypothetical protein